MNTARPRHAVVVPLPAQGHVNPLLDFAQLLAERGFFITFINTHWIEERIFKPPNDINTISRRMQQRGLNVRFLSLSDGLPPHHPRFQIIDEFFQAMHKLGPAMLRLLQTASLEAPPITCIVSDCLFACTNEVATALGVPRVLFWTMCSSAAIAFANSHLLLEKGYIPIKVKEAQCPENLITCLPGTIPPLRPTDLLTFFRIQDPGDDTFQIFLYESEIQNKADYVLVNVFEELEGPETVAGLSKDGFPALSIGPVFLPKLLKNNDSVVNITTSLWEDDMDCLPWLDKQTPSSVLYVSFGSIAVMSVTQLEELALGLEASGQPFLWVLRTDVSEGKKAELPEGFAKRISGRGMLVQWAPQVKVLSHPSVGGFLSHCGWNSTLESISMGVPIIGWPLWAEQFLNSRFSKEIWKIGMDFPSRREDESAVVKREEVENVVREMMEGTEGDELRKNAAKLKEAATKAVMVGGSSARNLKKFINDMLERANDSPEGESEIGGN